MMASLSIVAVLGIMMVLIAMVMVLFTVVAVMFAVAALGAVLIGRFQLSTPLVSVTTVMVMMPVVMAMVVMLSILAVVMMIMAMVMVMVLMLVISRGTTAIDAHGNNLRIASRYAGISAAEPIGKRGKVKIATPQPADCARRQAATMRRSQIGEHLFPLVS
jgi:predicted membrane protein